MNKQEFFDKIDAVRNILEQAGTIEYKFETAINMLLELREDAELVMDDEYDMGLRRGWNHSDGGDCE